MAARLTVDSPLLVSHHVLAVGAVRVRAHRTVQLLGTLLGSELLHISSAKAAEHLVGVKVVFLVVHLFDQSLLEYVVLVSAY